MSQTTGVHEHVQRVAGVVTSRYRKIEQCDCQDKDIQETSAPLLTVIDRCIEQDWHISFPYHHWYDYLDYLVGGYAPDREERWFEPRQARENYYPCLTIRISMRHATL